MYNGENANSSVIQNKEKHIRNLAKFNISFKRQNFVVPFNILEFLFSSTVI